MIALIGDIHGCIEPLREIVDSALQRCSTLVFLGDYVDRGADSSDVVAFLLALQADLGVEAHFLEGNHDVEFRRVLNGGSVDTLLRMGGAPTIASYVDEPYGDVGEQLRLAIPPSHREFFEHLLPKFEIDGLTAVHEAMKSPRVGEYVVAGHSLRHSLEPEIGKSTAYIDTGCGTVAGGRLTCLYWPDLVTVQSTVSWSEA
jgi:serine/threonine protein phosphatase 1